MARDELGPFGGFAALIGTLMIMVILIAVLGLVVVNAMKHSPWATSTVFATIPIAILIGFFLRASGRDACSKASVLGVALLLLAVWRRRLDRRSNDAARLFDLDGTALALVRDRLRLARGDPAGVAAARAARLPVDVPEAGRGGPAGDRDRASCIPTLKMPAVTQFIDGTGPLFGGKLFPFVFITIACGAISGFHALCRAAPRRS